MKLLASIFLFIGLSGCNQINRVNLIIHHAKIYSCDSSFHIYEAVAVNNGKIVAVGSNQEILNRYQADSAINLQGMTMVPGFIDAHAHFMGYGKSLFEVNLWGCTSMSELVNRVATFKQLNPNLPWIIGRGWDQNIFTHKEDPTNEELNRLFPDIPVFLTRVDGHAALVNEKALQIAGVYDLLSAQKMVSTMSLGGEIVIVNHQITGFLIDGATSLVQNKIPLPSHSDQVKFLLAAQKKCLGVGLVALHDAGLKKSDIEVFRELKKTRELNMDFHVMMDGTDQETLTQYGMNPIDENGLKVHSVKLYADGALGSRGALLKHEYADRHQYYGIRVTSLDSIKKIAAWCYQNKIQLCTHAIGDSANSDVLKIYDELLKGQNPFRWRIEHAQVVDPSDYSYFQKNKIIPSVQPTHATSDYSWVYKRLGAYENRGYAYRSLWNLNGFLALGSDFPVENINPLLGFYAAISRKNIEGQPTSGYFPNQSLTRKQALLGMTRYAAYAMQMEDSIGTIQPGKVAHFTVLNENIMEVPVEKIPSIYVKYTFIRGNIAYIK
jgi:predicted amidohydrolase YtcJ